MNVQITCPSCEVFNKVSDEKCWKCGRVITQDEKQAAIKDSEEKELFAKKLENPNPEDAKEILEKARQSGQWDIVPKAVLQQAAERIILTTSFNVAGHDIAEEIEIVTAEVVYGVNIFRDIFAGVRDFVGGRSSALQKVLRDARKMVLEELRKEALSVNADAVIAIDLDYQEITGGGKSGLIMLVASGTAVRITKA